MEQTEKIRLFLLNKLHIFAELAANTERQSRFIRKRQMTGLQRLLREREALLKALAETESVQLEDPQWRRNRDLMPLFQALAERQQEVFARSKQVLQEAEFELNRIAAELKRSKMTRKVNRQYVSYPEALLQGRRVNARA